MCALISTSMTENVALYGCQCIVLNGPIDLITDLYTEHSKNASFFISHFPHKYHFTSHKTIFFSHFSHKYHFTSHKTN